MVVKVSEQYTPPDITTSVILEDVSGIVPSRVFDVVLGVPPNNFIFNIGDKKRRQSSDNIVIIFNPAPIICTLNRNIYTNSFECECGKPKSFTNNFDINCGTNEFGFIKFSHGENSSGDILRTSTASVYNGTSITTSIGYRSQLNLPISVSHGDNVSSKLSYNYYFKPLFGFGSSTHVIIDYRPQLSIPVNVTTGDNNNTNISLTSRLAPTFGIGNSLSFNITPQYSVYFNGLISHGTNTLINIAFFPATNMSVTTYAGELLTSNINISTALQLDARYGHNVSAKLSTHNTFSSVVNSGTIANVNIEYKGPVTFNSNIHTGDNISSTLSSLMNLIPLNAVGENVLLNLSYFISTGSDVSAYSGTTFNSNITTYAQIKSNAYIGSTLNTVLGIRPPSYLSANMYEGTQVTASPNVTVGLSFTSSTGENVNTIAIDNIKNTYVYYGDNISIDLSSQTTFNNSITHGEHVSVSLKTGPSEPLGTFTFGYGSFIDYDLSVLVSTTFTPRFSFNTEFVQTIWDTTFVDLNTIACCAPKLTDLLHVNLQRNKEVEVRYDIPRDVSVNINMLTTPIFYAKVVHGTTLVVDEYDMLLTANFTYGDEVDILDLYNDLVVDLNSGNPEYGEDDVVIETSKDYTQFTNTFTSITDGLTLNSELSVSHGLRAVMYSGWTMQLDNFVTELAWRINFYNSFGLRWILNGNTQFHIYTSVGDTARLSGFYEDPLLFAAGEVMSTELVTDYDVGFVDDGCLDNGHIQTNSEGIPIFDPSREMAVEGQYYSRYIRGRCF